jgi:hypothetical protein
MTIDWRLNQQQREAVAKREQLAALNAQIERLGIMLAEAQAFEGHFAERLAEANRYAFEVGPRVDVNMGMDYGFPYWKHPGHPAEYERRTAVVADIEREQDEERARRTTTAQDGPHLLQFCALRSGDVQKKLDRAVMARDAVARELADSEGRLSPGQLVQAGVAAGEYVEHRQRVQALRERVEAAS